MSDVTRILSQVESGDPSAAEQLLPLMYEELRKLAAAKLAHEELGQTLQATALAHEAYLRLVGDQQSAAPSWNSRGHFFAAAAEAMRRILVDHARHRNSAKRGGKRQRLETVELPAPEELRVDDLLDLDEALSQSCGGWASARTVPSKPPVAVIAIGISAAVRPRTWRSPERASSSRASLCSWDLTPTFNQPNRRGTDPYARWCGRAGSARLPPLPIARGLCSCQRGRGIAAHRTTRQTVLLIDNDLSQQ